MSLPRLLMNLLLVLALVASGPLAAFAAEPAERPASAAPCHDLDEPAPAPHGGKADCCAGESGHCGCDCLHHAAAAPLRLMRSLHPLPASLEAVPLAGTLPRSLALPDTRPPIS